jgi:hypothetical protein
LIQADRHVMRIGAFHMHIAQTCLKLAVFFFGFLNKKVPWTLSRTLGGRKALRLACSFDCGHDVKYRRARVGRLLLSPP